jgi:transaldolase
MAARRFIAAENTGIVLIIGCKADSSDTIDSYFPQMKFFLDTANLEELKNAIDWGIIDGVTTNPSLIAKELVPLEEQIRKICEIIDGDISAEVVSTSARDMIEEGRRLSRISESVVVKVPLVSEGIKAVSVLWKEGIRTNVTLCFSAAQALLAAKAGAYIVSPFIGRIDDIGWPGMDLIREIVTIYANYGYKTQVLAASIRGPLHVVNAAKAGAHICTVPFKVLEQMFHHPLTEKGLDQFLKDYRKTFDFVTA